MLNLTMTTGERLKIGEDIQIIFESTPSIGRIKVGVEAPRDKYIARMPGEKKHTGNVMIVKNSRQAKNNAIKERIEVRKSCRQQLSYLQEERGKG